MILILRRKNLKEKMKSKPMSEISVLDFLPLVDYVVFDLIVFVEDTPRGASTVNFNIFKDRYGRIQSANQLSLEEFSQFLLNINPPLSEAMEF